MSMSPRSSINAISQHQRISVVIPLFNEYTVLPELASRLEAVLDDLPGGPHEVVFVNDGSTDGTEEALDQLASEQSRFRVLHLSRNFGHQAAITAGLESASGDFVVTMDGDLQDPPETLPVFIAKAREGYDVVYAQRVRRKERWYLRAAYFLAYRLISSLADIPLPLDAGDFGLLSRRVVDAVCEAPERQRYLRGLRSWAGFRQVGVEVERHERAAGLSKYTFGKLLRLAFDGLFAFSVIPLRLATVMGVAAVVAAGAYGCSGHLLQDLPRTLAAGVYRPYRRDCVLGRCPDAGTRCDR